MRAVSERLRFGSIRKVQEIREKLHLFTLRLQTSVITVEFGHFRREVADNALDHVQRDSEQTGVVAEGMTATVEVFDRDGTVASCGFARGDDVAFLFQKGLDAVGNATAVMQVHLDMKWQDVFSILALHPLLSKFFEVIS